MLQSACITFTMRLLLLFVPLPGCGTPRSTEPRLQAVNVPDITLVQLQYTLNRYSTFPHILQLSLFLFVIATINSLPDKSSLFLIPILSRSIHCCVLYVHCCLLPCLLYQIFFFDSMHSFHSCRVPNIQIGFEGASNYFH